MEEPEISAPDTVLEGFAKENQLLKTWVIGLVTECEGCTKEATKWVEAMEPIKTFKHTE